MTKHTLKDPWHQLYLSTRMAPDMAQHEPGRRLHGAFNDRLRAYLAEAQDHDWVPSKNELHEAAAEMMNILREDQIRGKLSGRRPLSPHETARWLDNILEKMAWAPMHGKDERLQIIGTIDELELPENGIEWLAKALPSHYDEQWHHLLVVLADVRCDREVDRRWIPRLAEVAKRQSRQIFKEYAEKEKGAMSGFYYRPLRRLKDWWIIRVG